MSTYYESLSPVIKKRLEPLMPVLQREATKAGVPLDYVLSIAVKESGGQAGAVGDKNLAKSAKGLYQVRDNNYWFGGKAVDPLDPVAATVAIMPRMRNLYDDCKGDPTCMHFKYMAGQNAQFTPEVRAQREAKFPHLRERLASVENIFGAGGTVQGAPREAGAGRGFVTPPRSGPPGTVPIVSANEYLGLADIAAPLPPPDTAFAAAGDGFANAMMAINPYADAGATVKSRKRTNILGL